MMEKIIDDKERDGKFTVLEKSQWNKDYTRYNEGVFFPEKRKLEKGILSFDTPNNKIQDISNEIFGCRFKFHGKSIINKYEGIFECKKHGVLFSHSLTSHLQGSVPSKCEECWKENHKNVCLNRKKVSNIPNHKNSDEEIRDRFNGRFGGKLYFVKRDAEDYRYGFFKCIHGKQIRTIIQKKKDYWQIIFLWDAKLVQKLTKNQNIRVLLNIFERNH